MKYPYIVNKNGVYYPAGTDVPEDNVQEKFIVDGKSIGHVEGDVIVIEDDEIIKETSEEIRKEHNFTKTKINQMTTSELKALATEIGIEGADEITGSNLKKVLIEFFGL